MKALILNGTQVTDRTGNTAYKALRTTLESRGFEIEHIILEKKNIHTCDGNFLCWIQIPGMCIHNDDNRKIAELMIQSDLMIFLTPVIFGGYSSLLKGFVDHLIQNILPFFSQIEGVTHHKKRYTRYPDFFTIGILDNPDEEKERLFKDLTYRNSLNFYSRNHYSSILYRSMNQEQIQTAIDLGMKGTIVPVGPEIFSSPEIGNIGTIHNTLLLVGSPRKKKSTSKSLGTYLLDSLSKAGVTSEIWYVHSILKASTDTQALMDDLDKADLIILSYPLYVDTLPAPVIKILEVLRTYREKKGSSKQQYFISIANCGFPEALHCDNAQQICRQFSNTAGFSWAGSLSLGGGEMIHGAGLTELGGRTIPVRKALELTAQALTNGSSIPESAGKMITKPVIPHWLYRLFGSLGWKGQAKKYGMHKKLTRRPYEPLTAGEE